MGIPSYFVHIVKNHSNIIKKFQTKDINIDNLYIDSNSIVYDAIRHIEYNMDDNNFERKLVNWVSERITYYIDLIQPTQRVLIAFDGVAPVAKLEQQRNRRYKTWFTKEYVSNKETKKSWDTTAITPGTNFMDILCAGINNHFKNKYKNLQIIISASDKYGEGEHKIYQYIRDERRYHYDTNTVIYGLDADLIMLTLIHTKISPNLYLFRETPHFISSVNSNLLPDEHYVLDIYELGQKLNEQMSPNQDKDCICDYIFLCFLLGNDFMPHFPALNIRTNGITILLETYHFLFKKGESILTNNKICWKNLRILIEELAKHEEQFALDEMKQREKHENNLKKKLFKTLEEELNAQPMCDRKLEKYINIGETGWQQRYYKELFGIEITDIRRKQICINYLEGLEWNLKYYTSGCPDWKWKYNYKYPPLLEDLYKYIPYFDTTFIENKEAAPVKPLVQLAYVLPRNSLHLLPHNIYEKLVTEYKDWYRLDYEIVWAYCKYFWESHIVSPHIDIDILNSVISNDR